MNIKQTSFCTFILEFKGGSVVVDEVKQSKGDIQLYSVKNSSYLNYNADGATLNIQNAGEYEVKDIFINSRKNKDTESYVYNISSEGITVGVISFVNELSAIPEDFFENTDILIIGAGGGPLFTAKDANSLLNKLSPSIAIVFGFKEQAGKDLQNTLDSIEDVKKEISGLTVLDKSLKLDKDYVNGIENTIYHAFDI